MLKIHLYTKVKRTYMYILNLTTQYTTMIQIERLFDGLIKDHRHGKIWE